MRCAAGDMVVEDMKEACLPETIAELFLASASKFAAKPAIIDGSRRLAFREYAGAALSVAAALEKRGEAERVALLLPTSDAFALVFFGAVLSGRTPVPLNFFLTAEELSFLVGDCGAKTVITTRFFETVARALPAETVFVEEFIPEALSLPPTSPARPNAIATILYTSGTTGRPKGVILSNRNILANIRGCVEHFRFSSSNVLLGILPFFHTFALTTTLVLPAAIGATAVLMKRFEPAGAIAAIAANKVTTVIAVPSLYKAMMRAISSDAASLASIELLISGGEPLPEDVFEAYSDRYGVTIYEGYGLTETSPVVAANTPWGLKPFTVGRPLPGVEVRVADEIGEDAGINADGEILIRADSVMEGYLNLPDETRAALTGNGFFRSGDIGRIDEEGFLKITGRKKEMMISAGENIFPAEIERTIARHPAVAEVAVIGIPDAVRGEAPKAFVILKKGAAATAEELKAFCREHIARYKVPSEIEFRTEFPHSPTGKILKQRLVKTPDSTGRRA